MKRFTIEDTSEEIFKESNNNESEIPLEKKQTNSQIDNKTSERIYEKDSSYYDYDLVGVLIHSGGAEAGHYYSFINVKREGSSNKMFFDRAKDANDWLRFDDSVISSFNIKNLEDECFGGSKTENNSSGGAAYGAAGGWGASSSAWSDDISKSAYMLVYERRQKCPIKYTVKEDEAIKYFSQEYLYNNTVKRNEENRDAVKKEFNFFYNDDDTSLECETTAQSRRRKIVEKVFLDEERKEYYYYKDFYEIEKVALSTYYNEVLEDNFIFLNDQRVYTSKFTGFIDKLLKNIINAIKPPQTDDPDQQLQFVKKISLDLLKTYLPKFLEIIFNVIFKSNYKEGFSNIVKNFGELFKIYPELTEEFLTLMLKKYKTNILDVLISTEESTNTLFKDLFASAVWNGFDFRSKEIESYLSSLDKPINNDLIQIDDNSLPVVVEFVDHLLSLIPTDISKNWQRLCAYCDVSYLLKLALGSVMYKGWITYRFPYEKRDNFKIS